MEYPKTDRPTNQIFNIFLWPEFLQEQKLELREREIARFNSRKRLA
jgi:hypothetical protein